MKKLAALALGFTVLSCTRVPAGHVGVKVDLYGSGKGVNETALPVGSYFLGWGVELYTFPTFSQNYVWTAAASEGSPNDESISFQTKEGLSVNGDFGITYAINPDKVVMVFQKYRRGVEEITDTFLRSIVRDSIGKKSSSMSVEAVYGEGKAALLESVTNDVKSAVEPIGINIERIYLIGELRLPAVVKTAIESKIEETQKAERARNEKATAEAQAAIRQIQAEAEANAIKAVNDSLTAGYIKYIEIQKWNGVKPLVMQGSDGEVIVDLKGLVK